MSALSLAFTPASSIEAYHLHLALSPPSWLDLSFLLDMPPIPAIPVKVNFYQVQWRQYADHIRLSFACPGQICYAESASSLVACFTLNLSPKVYKTLLTEANAKQALPFFQGYQAPIMLSADRAAASWQQLGSYMHPSTSSLEDTIKTYVGPILDQVRQCYLTHTNKETQRLAQAGPIEKFHHIIHQHFNALRAGLVAEPINVQECADQLHLTTRDLSFLIRKETKDTAVTHINRVWIEQAKHMLVQTSLRVKIIAWQLGFKDPAYFTRLFSRIVGMPPKQYRQENNPLQRP